MQYSRAFKSLLARIACLTIMLNAIAPTLSHALAGNDTEQTAWMQVCTVAGMKLVPLSLGDAPTESDKLFANQPAQDLGNLMSMQHCAYCFNHAGSWALPSAAEFVLHQPNLSYQLPALFYHCPRPLFAWASANPRAPPFSA